jgi:hypothetical protein
MGVFRNEACTLVLDDWPTLGKKPRSPKWVFGKEDNIFIRITAPSGKGNNYFKVLVTSESAPSPGGVTVDLTEVSPGIYKNVGVEQLRLGDTTVDGNIDYIEVLDEEVVTFTVIQPALVPGSEPCRLDVMLDRFELLRVAGSDLKNTANPAIPSGSELANVFNDMLAKELDAFTTANHIPWFNGYLSGKNYDPLGNNAAADLSNENLKVSALSKGFDTSLPNMTSSDLPTYARHGLEGVVMVLKVGVQFGFPPSVNQGVFWPIRTWTPPPNVYPQPVLVTLDWTRDVDWFPALACEVFGIMDVNPQTGLRDVPKPDKYVSCWKNYLSGTSLHMMLGCWDNYGVRRTIGGGGLAAFQTLKTFVETCESGSDSVLWAWMQTIGASDPDNRAGVLYRESNKDDMLVRPSAATSGGFVTQDDPTSSFSYIFNNLPVTPPRRRWWFFLVPIGAETNYIENVQSVMASLIFTGRVTVTTFSVDEDSAQSNHWASISNITGQASTPPNVGEYSWMCRGDLGVSIMNSPVNVGADECKVMVSARLSSVPTNEWRIAEVSVGGNTSLDDNRTTTNQYFLTWQHYLTDRAVLINDWARVGVGSGERYFLSKIVQTRCKVTGYIDVDGLTLRSDLPEPKPQVEQHYMKKGGSIRPVWFICTPVPIIVDCLTREVVVSDD